MPMPRCVHGARPIGAKPKRIHVQGAQAAQCTKLKSQFEALTRANHSAACAVQYCRCGEKVVKGSQDIDPKSFQTVPTRVSKPRPKAKPSSKPSPPSNRSAPISRHRPKSARSKTRARGHGGPARRRESSAGWARPSTPWSNRTGCSTDRVPVGFRHFPLLHNEQSELCGTMVYSTSCCSWHHRVRVCGTDPHRRGRRGNTRGGETGEGNSAAPTRTRTRTRTCTRTRTRTRTNARTYGVVVIIIAPPRPQCSTTSPKRRPQQVLRSSSPSDHVHRPRARRSAAVVAVRGRRHAD